MFRIFVTIIVLSFPLFAFGQGGGNHQQPQPVNGVSLDIFDVFSGIGLSLVLAFLEDSISVYVICFFGIMIGYYAFAYVRGLFSAMGIIQESPYWKKVRENTYRDVVLSFDKLAGHRGGVEFARTEMRQRLKEKMAKLKADEVRKQQEAEYAAAFNLHEAEYRSRELQNRVETDSAFEPHVGYDGALYEVHRFGNSEYLVRAESYSEGSAQNEVQDDSGFFQPVAAVSEDDPDYELMRMSPLGSDNGYNKDGGSFVDVEDVFYDDVKESFSEDVERKFQEAQRNFRLAQRHRVDGDGLNY